MIERDTGRRPEFIAATPVQVGVAQIPLLTENGYTLVRLRRAAAKAGSAPATVEHITFAKPLWR